MVLTTQGLINNYLDMLFHMYKRADSLLLFLQDKYDIAKNNRSLSTSGMMLQFPDDSNKKHEN